MSGLEFGNLAQLQLLWIVGGVAVVAFLSLRRYRNALRRFASPAMLDRLLEGVRPRSRWNSLVLGLATLVLLVLCLIDIRYGRVRREIPQRGIEVMFALDVSRSMLAEDVSPNRLERAKQMIRDTLDEMAGDRAGLTLFAGQAVQRIPMTRHYDDFKQTLAEVSPSDLVRGGSNLGEAIRVAADGFNAKTGEHRAIVLLTDGEDLESQPVEAAREAAETRGVRLFTIGLGDMQTGARIPLPQERGGGFVQHDGEQVWSRLQGDVLQAIAEASGGAYVPAGTRRVSMADVYHGYISRLEKTEFDTARIDAFEARYQWPCAAAALLMMLDLIFFQSLRRRPEERIGN